MKRTFLKFLAPVALFCLPYLAEAAPGGAITETSVTPQNAPKLIAAIDKFMASPVGKQYKGRLLLQARVADGTDPATHSIVNLYHSLADYEAFNKLAQNDPAWAEFLNTVVPISTQVSTGLAGIVKSWGNVNDTDVVWVVHSFNVTDPAAMVAALDTWMASPGGKKSTGQVHLWAMSASGVATPNVTHSVAVGYASLTAMEADGAALANDPDLAKLLAAMQKVSTHLGASIEQTVKTWGPATLKAVTQQ